ncbi:hypothetical protein CAI21_02255 [Alkalilimnicola ehrlichii]|uniref:Zinc finger/thioredoxin putative domain-containing protein n=1 Tax=Alkalilimnicola ehrlichii TaxID=351052 RepID=A0A3E0X1A8_9GAMM|nr:DUF3426 domain-containing protein [Alkalilimnicola ehrlichii]RFA31505.1 hypothetical protein CAI21_02255 [Alkalilimnicola ehrlichii]RFA39277.1 hypothetical protein CAL65_00135 [Alkalilimnicola ehrlichii]
MYTQCSHCLTLFRVSPRQLDVAGGQVRCCLCNRPFDAHDTLCERLPPGLAAEYSPAREHEATAVVETPTKDANEAGEGLVGPEGSESERYDPELGALPELNIEAEPLPALEPELNDAVEVGESAVADEDPPARGGAQAPSAVDAVPADAIASEARADFSTELDLRFEPELEAAEKAAVHAQPAGRTALWASGILLLIAALVLQYAYFARDDLARHTELRPLLERMCTLVGCELALPRAADRFRIVHRQVAPHPEVGGALLVEARFRNEAGFKQAYPQLGLTLFDANGRRTGYRWFAPEEYLAADAVPAIAEGMPAQATVAVRLEIEDPGNGSENFEFGFR